MTRITMLIPYVPDGERAVERIFGCNYGLYPMPNIFVLYSASALESAGFEVAYVDAPLEGWTEDQFKNFIRDDSSAVYVVYSTLLAKQMDINAHQIIRQIKPDIPMVYIGPAPTDDPAFFLPDENSYVIRGEPELTLVDLVKLIVNDSSKPGKDQILSIPGISVLKDEQIQNSPSSGVIENLDSLPHPARHLIDPGKYWSPKLGVSPVTVMLTSRGCNAKCIYCVPCSLSFARELEYRKINNRKPPVRIRSEVNVIEEIDLIAKSGIKGVSIIDDQFLWGEKRTAAIAGAFKKHNIAWGCLARADMVTEPIAKILSETNCRFIDLGVESFNPEILAYIQKGVSVEETENAIRLLKKYGVFVKANILLGSSPLETRETVKQTVMRAIELGVDSIMVGATNPFPGTQFYELAKQNGWFMKGDYYPSDSQREWVMEYPHFTRQDMDDMLRWANRKFFFRIGFFARQIHRLKNPVDFARTVKTFFKKLAWTWQ
jgi:anaerobic magnesium-protoporphyrin IX monomethyl ester cyclase